MTTQAVVSAAPETAAGGAGAGPSTAGRVRRQRIIVACALAAMMLTAVAGAWQDLTIEVAAYHFWDEGYAVLAGARLAAGQVPYRDYGTLYPPLSLLLIAGSLKLFGPSLWAAKLPLAVFVAAAFPLAYRWLRYAWPRYAALAGTVGIWATLPKAVRLPYPNPMTLVPILFAFIQIERMRPGRVLGPAAWAGVACGVCIGLKHPIGLILGMAIWVRLLCSIPYARLFPAASGRPQPMLTAFVRTAATAIVLLALANTALTIVSAPRSMIIALLPPAVLTVAAAVHAYRAERATPQPVDWRALVLTCLVLGGGIAATIIPWVLWLLRHHALRDFLTYGGLVQSADSTAWADFYGRLFAPPLPGPGVYLLGFAAAAALISVFARSRWAGGVTAAVALALPAVTLAANFFTSYVAMCYAPLLLLLGVAVRPRPGAWRSWLALVSVTVLAAQAYPATTVTHATDAVTLAFGVVLAWTWALSAGRVAPRLAVPAVIAALCFCWWSEWATALVARKAGGGWHLADLRMLPGPRGGTLMPGEMVDKLVATEHAIDALAPPGAPLVAWPSLALINFYTGRPNPTELNYYWPGLLSAPGERRVLEQLDTGRPPVIVLDRMDSLLSTENFFGHHARLMRYINANYVSVQSVGDWEILRHKVAAKPARLPAPAEIGTAIPSGGRRQGATTPP